jgi:hypothetical protein
VTGPCHEQGSGDEGGLRGMGNDIRVIRDQRHVGPTAPMPQMPLIRPWTGIRFGG